MSLTIPKRPSIHTIESSVTRLLVLTKHLLSLLTLWATMRALEADVSDAYVQLGNEFKVACKIFSAAGVDVTDLGDVPQSLREVLEEALCEPPSQESLDLFLPVIREIIIALLKNLKRKQEDFRVMESTVRRSVSSPPDAPAPRQLTDTPPTSGQSLGALEKLQNGDTLQRRASKRFSAYQYAKLTNHHDLDLPKDRRVLADFHRPEGSRLSMFEEEAEVPDPGMAAKPDAHLLLEVQSSDTAQIYLRLLHKTKRVVVSLPTSLASLRLLFMETFAYSPGAVPFPDIYIQDPTSGVSFELDELAVGSLTAHALLLLNEPDARDASLLKLESELAALRRETQLANGALLDQLKELWHTGPGSGSIPGSGSDTSQSRGEPLSSETGVNLGAPMKVTLRDLRELDDIRRDLAAIRQMNKAHKEAIKVSVSGLRSTLGLLQLLTGQGKPSGRVYMERCHTKLSQDSDQLLTKVDDLQDVIEALRKDVVARGVRPSEKQISAVSKDMLSASEELRLMGAYIQHEKGRWKQIWESELDTVCEEQQFFTLQEDLIQDLAEDLAKALETFNLVEQCSQEQNKNPRVRGMAGHLPIPEPGSLNLRRDAMLSEVAALTPNHESRVEAIERAERLRQRDLAMRAGDIFEEELEGFVENNRLKKSGGIEEIERLRQLKDEANLRTMSQR